MNFDPTKPVQTRNGCKARVICTDRKNERGFQIVALITNHCRSEHVGTYRKDGSYLDELGGGFDLINIPEPNELLPCRFCGDEPTIKREMEFVCTCEFAKRVGRHWIYYNINIADLPCRSNDNVLSELKKTWNSINELNNPFIKGGK